MESFLKNLFTAQQYDENNFFLIAGPCVIESKDVLDTVASRVSAICKNLGIPYVFKASYRKANRTSAASFTGLGDDLGLNLLRNTGNAFSLHSFAGRPIFLLLLEKQVTLSILKKANL